MKVSALLETYRIILMSHKIQFMKRKGREIAHRLCYLPPWRRVASSK
jgi:hypothetical protein